MLKDLEHRRKVMIEVIVILIGASLWGWVLYKCLF
jgi:hypothetical protein